MQAFIFLALFIEGTVQWLKKEYRNVFTYVALLLGVVVAVGAHADLLALAGIKGSPLVGNFMAGVVFARGANVLNDLFGWVKVNATKK